MSIRTANSTFYVSKMGKDLSQYDKGLSLIFLLYHYNTEKVQ